MINCKGGSPTQRFDALVGQLRADAAEGRR